MTIEFLITSLIVILIPGTGVIYTVSHGLFRGKLASIVAAVGCTFGILPHIATSIIGITAVVQINIQTFQIFKLAGSAYLFYLAWEMWRESGNVAIKQIKKQKGIGRICLDGFLINILNPKLSVFFLAFLPQFVTTNSAAPFALMISMSAIFMILTLLIFTIYGLMAVKLSSYVVSSPRVTKWTQRTLAGSFAAFGLKLTLTN
jgi:threonine/homoserine/homoserine lactone efflux protein